MKYLNSIVLVGFTACLFSCGDLGKKDAELNVIPVEAALQNPVKIKASDCFKKVRYVPLETTDSCVLGRRPTVQVTKDRLIVTTAQQQCYAFDKQTGRFLGSIGRVGNSPEESNTLSGWVNYPANLIYFPVRKQDHVVYDLDGNYVRDLTCPYEIDGSFQSPKFANLDATTYLVYCMASANQPDRLVIFRDTTVLQICDTYGEKSNSDSTNPADIQSISVETKNTADNAFMHIVYKDGKQTSATRVGGNPFWYAGKDVCFKEAFNDTIYRVTDKGLQFARVFDFGSKRWDIMDRKNMDKDNAIYPVDIYENEEVILFRFIMNLYHVDKRVSYNGIFNKSTGEVKVSLYDDGIEDDLTHFLPFQPNSASPNGEFAQVIPVDKILTWFDEHSDSSNLSKEVIALKQIGEEDNPVVVIME